MENRKLKIIYVCLSSMLFLCACGEHNIYKFNEEENVVTSKEVTNNETILHQENGEKPKWLMTLLPLWSYILMM